VGKRKEEQSKRGETNIKQMEQTSYGTKKRKQSFSFEKKTN